MPHHTPLIATIVAGLTLAFAFGALAHRLRLPPLVGYLVAGVVVGPFTPGYVADQELATELAEIGVILLMFGVGLHFSLRDLLAVRKIAIPGAVVQMAAATVLGMGLAYMLGWSPVAGFVFGLGLSVASTVVLLKALQERRILQTDRGRIAVGWLIVEDLAMVLALVVLPALAGALTNADRGVLEGWIQPIGLTLMKVAAFVILMLVVGRRVIPWILHWTAHTGSRELFRLAVLAMALGVAFGAAALFGVSFALGAFFAGMILAESQLSQQAAEDTLPLRDAFAVLFFVSVGMLFNPSVLIQEPLPLLATVAIIVLGKSVAAFAIVRAFRHNTRTALTISASLAQIGEFSFILANLGTELRLLPEAGRDLILGGAIISILLNPLIFRLLAGATARRTPEGRTEPPSDLIPTALSEHSILVGFGRVGAAVAKGLEVAGHPVLVVELDEAARRRARDAGLETLQGNAADPHVLTAAGLARARRVIVSIPNGFEAGGVVHEARRSRPGLQIVARAHSDAQVEHLRKKGADTVVLGEQELADAMLNQIRVREHPPRTDSTPSSTSLAPPDARLVLTDPEWALLAGVRDVGVGPGQSVSKAALAEKAAQYAAFADERLAEATVSLMEKGCLTELGDGRVRVTRTGFVAAANAPTT